MNSSFLEIAFSRQVVVNALKVALIVGTILGVINHGDKLVTSSLTGENVIQIALTYIVPYCVSSYSAVKALQDKQNNKV